MEFRRVLFRSWALPLALKLQLGALGAWPSIEYKITEKLDDIVRRIDKDGNPLPLDLPTIQRAHDWLVAQFSLPSLLVEKPTFVLRIYNYFKSKAPPEAPLINRSEERRVGKECVSTCRSRWLPCNNKK